ncbi:MAG: hypothetical protein HQL27_02515 [Candidatus Omnitrophica bacterium]|nr:hypothetical protein [Candidatus Omnitrophota bacterium]
MSTDKNRVFTTLKVILIASLLIIVYSSLHLSENTNQIIQPVIALFYSLLAIVTAFWLFKNLSKVESAPSDPMILGEKNAFLRFRYYIRLKGAALILFALSLGIPQVLFLATKDKFWEGGLETFAWPITFLILWSIETMNLLILVNKKLDKIKSQ